MFIVQYWHISFELVQIRGVDHVLGYGGLIKAVKGRRISASADISLGASKQTEIERNHGNDRHKFSQMNGTDVYFILPTLAFISANENNLNNFALAVSFLTRNLDFVHSGYQFVLIKGSLYIDHIDSSELI